MIAVYRAVPQQGPCTVICVGGNDDHGLGNSVDLCAPNQRQSAIVFQLPASQRETYYVAVSGANPVEFGNFELLVLPTTDIDDGITPTTPAPIATPAPIVPTPAPVVTTPAPIATPAPQGTECSGLFQSCNNDVDCCDGGICVLRVLGPPEIKLCSSQFVRVRAKNSIGNGDRGGAAGRQKAGAP